MTFFACQKERILPISLENQEEQSDIVSGFEDLGDGTKSSGDAGDGSTGIDGVSNGDDEDDIDDEDKVTDPDDDEDFESEDLNEKID